MTQIQPIQSICPTIWQKRQYEKLERLKRNYCACVKHDKKELAEAIFDRIILKENQALEKGYQVDITV
jgi:hypothetical protein